MKKTKYKNKNVSFGLNGNTKRPKRTLGILKRKTGKNEYLFIHSTLLSFPDGFTKKNKSSHKICLIVLRIFYILFYFIVIWKRLSTTIHLLKKDENKLNNYTDVILWIFQDDANQCSVESGNTINNSLFM